MRIIESKRNSAWFVSKQGSATEADVRTLALTYMRDTAMWAVCAVETDTALWLDDLGFVGVHCRAPQRTVWICAAGGGVLLVHNGRAEA